jgi:EF hand
MLRRTSVLWVTVLMAAVLIAIAAMLGTALARQASAPKSQDKLAKGEPEVKQLLLLMDTDKNGKISKQEWMTFMEAEFDRLDKDKSGELDVKELTQTRIRGFLK